MSDLMQLRAQRQWDAAQEAREIASSFSPTPCSCCSSVAKHARVELRRLARSHPNPIITDEMLWIAWRDNQRKNGNWPPKF